MTNRKEMAIKIQRLYRGYKVRWYIFMYGNI